MRLETNGVVDNTMVLQRLPNIGARPVKQVGNRHKIGYFAALYFNDSSIQLTSLLALATAGVFIAISIFWTIQKSGLFTYQ